MYCRESEIKSPVYPVSQVYQSLLFQVKTQWLFLYVYGASQYCRGPHVDSILEYQYLSFQSTKPFTCNHSSPCLWIPYLPRTAHTVAPASHSQREFSQGCSTVDSVYGAAVVLYCDDLVDTYTCFCMGFSQSPLCSIDDFLNGVYQDLHQITHLKRPRLALLPCKICCHAISALHPCSLFVVL